MFQLLQPIWLYALAGLSVPLAIHFWNQRPGKTLRVGSIALVAATQSIDKRKIQLSELLLLLLRCCLLACISVALSAPFWRSPAGNNAKGWVLIGTEGLPATYRQFKPVIDSLLQVGAEFHYFEQGFKKDKLENALQTIGNNTTPVTVNYRKLVAALDEKVSSQQPVYLFTDNYLRHFNGTRTAADMNLHWYTYTPDTTTALPAADTSSMQVTIFTREYSNDALYLQAALEAIQQTGRKRLSVKLVNQKNDIPARQDWLCWFSDDTPVNGTASHILQNVSGKKIKNNSYMLPANSNGFDGIGLYNAVIADDTTGNGVVYWKDGFGRPLLTKTQNAGIDIYHLYTHIDPAWNELAWSADFPRLLLQLLYPVNDSLQLAGAADKTIIDHSQLMPLLPVTNAAFTKTSVFTDTDLASACWILAMLLFFAERVLSFYHYKKMGNA